MLDIIFSALVVWNVLMGIGMAIAAIGCVVWWTVRSAYENWVLRTMASGKRW